LGTGTPSSANFLRGDGAWEEVPVSPEIAYKEFTQSGTYTPPTGVIEFYVFVLGSTGGVANVTRGAGRGGAGYSEKKYTAPFTGAPYSYAVGAGGNNTGNAGGTTTFDTISITGSGGVTGIVGSAGGVATGGTLNANGGTGGAGRTASTVAPGGGGGSGSRAGNGGNGGNATSGVGGGGGGTGGNDASGPTGGAAATSEASGVVALPLSLLGNPTVVFAAGANAAGTTNGGRGASSVLFFDTVFPLTAITSNLNLNNGGTSLGGIDGKVCILEVY
jgi:hypothetical protein